jgi:hypothetical protein
MKEALRPGKQGFMRKLLIAATFAAAFSVGAAAQETAGDPQAEKTPKDSVKVVVTGCVKDRLLRASRVQTPDDDALDVRRSTFRLSGKKGFAEQVKRLEGRQLAVTGYIRKLDLREPGLRVKGGRVVLGAPSMDPRRPPLPDATDRPVVLEVVSFEPLEVPCLK